MLVGLTAWKKDRNVQNLTTDQHQSNVQGITNPGLREAQAPPLQTSQPPQTGMGIGLNALLFWTSCCCNWMLLVCGILYHRYHCPNHLNLPECATAGGPKVHQRIYHWATWAKKVQLLGTSSSKAPTGPVPMDHTGTLGGTSKVPIPQFP